MDSGGLGGGGGGAVQDLDTRGNGEWRGGGQGFSQMDGGGLGGGGGGAGRDLFGGGGGAFRHGAAQGAYVAGSIGGAVEPSAAQQSPEWRPTAHSASVPARAQTVSATSRVASQPRPPPPPDPPLAPSWLCKASVGRLALPASPPGGGDGDAWRRAGQAAKDTISLEYRPGLPPEFQAMIQQLRREKAVEAIKLQRTSSAAALSPRPLPPRPGSGPAASRRTPPQPQPRGQEQHRPPRVQSAAPSKERRKLAPSAQFFDLGSELGLGGGLPVMRVKPKARDVSPTPRQGGARPDSGPGRQRGTAAPRPNARPSTAAVGAQPRGGAERWIERPSTAAAKVELRSPAHSPSAPHLGGRTVQSRPSTAAPVHPFFTEGNAARPQGVGSRVPKYVQ